MITPKETKITYKEATIRIVNQAQTLLISWKSTLDGSEGHVQATTDDWTDGEILRLVMETIDRFRNQHHRLQQKRQA